jgi:hypothetical protein
MKALLNFRSCPINGIKLAITVLILMTDLNLTAQQDPIRKNTIRFNLTNPLIFGSKSKIIGYERILKKNQSFSINVGIASFPGLSFGNNDSLKSDPVRVTKEKGFNVSADYRWYLGSVNKYRAPRGIYIGPYCSYNYFNRTNDWVLNTTNFQGNVQTDFTMKIQTVGFQLGYQFVFKNRISLDMILAGPGISGYSLKAKLSTTLEPQDEKLFFDALNNFLSSKIPGYDRVISADEFKRTGSVSTTSLGFRYMVMIGYRF